MAGLEQAGFRVAVDHADYTVTMPARRWLGMMQGRFWSNFHACSDAELEAGLQEVRDKLGVGGDEDRPISFPDRIVFITGTKPAAQG